MLADASLTGLKKGTPGTRPSEEPPRILRIEGMTVQWTHGRNRLAAVGWNDDERTVKR